MPLHRENMYIMCMFNHSASLNNNNEQTLLETLKVKNKKLERLLTLHTIESIFALKRISKNAFDRQ